MNDYRNSNLGYDTFIKTNSFCKICGWELIDCCGNFTKEVEDKFGETVGDWFIYCGNKSCINHSGVWYGGGEDVPL